MSSRSKDRDVATLDCRYIGICTLSFREYHFAIRIQYVAVAGILQDHVHHMYFDSRDAEIWEESESEESLKVAAVIEVEG